MRGPLRRVRNCGGVCDAVAGPQRSESRRGPLILVASLLDFSPHAGRGECKPSHSRTLLYVRAARSQSREARSGSEKNREGWLASVSVFAFPVSPASLRATAKQSSLNSLVSGSLRLFVPRDDIKDMERRKTQGRPPHLGGQLAFRRSTTALPKGCVVPWCDPGQVSWANRPRGGGHSADGSPHFQRRTSHAGRNAGRHDARTARERVASPPAGSASRPTAATTGSLSALSARQAVYS